VTTDYRALCAELADAYLRLLEHVNNSTWLGYNPSDDPLLVRTRAALSASEQGPTDEELDRLLYYKFTTSTGHVEHSDPIGFARAMLARWGSISVVPVPVAERLPGREDCNAEGRCWLTSVDVEPGWVTDNPEQCTNWTHWLPHWALPVPQEVNQ
jgi:hypothetical protein